MGTREIDPTNPGAYMILLEDGMAIMPDLTQGTAEATAAIAAVVEHLSGVENMHLPDVDFSKGGVIIVRADSVTAGGQADIVGGTILDEDHVQLFLSEPKGVFGRPRARNAWNVTQRVAGVPIETILPDEAYIRTEILRVEAYEAERKKRRGGPRLKGVLVPGHDC